jgi:hypothetical protein
VICWTGGRRPAKNWIHLLSSLPEEAYNRLQNHFSMVEAKAKASLSLGQNPVFLLFLTQSSKNEKNATR